MTNLQAGKKRSATRALGERLVLKLMLLLAAFVPVGGASAADAAATTDALRAIVEDEAKSGFSGAVLVARGDDVLLDMGVGAIAGTEMLPSSRFWIASAGKQFTSAAILRCAERGLLTLDTPLADLLPDVPADKSGITVRQLLSYTSGLPQSEAGEIVASAAEAATAILALPLEAAPGEKFIYANGNYILAAAIVERVSGTPFADFMRQEIFEPAGLRDSGQVTRETMATVAPIAGELPPRLRDPRWMALGYYSTTGDINRWMRALHAGTVLSPASVQALFAPAAPIQEGQSALGWFIGASPAGARRIFTRGNEDMGANAAIYYYPDSDTLIVVLTHAGDANGELSWSRHLHRRLEQSLGL